jgi:hypothetical protein
MLVYSNSSDNNTYDEMEQFDKDLHRLKYFHFVSVHHRDLSRAQRESTVISEKTIGLDKNLKGRVDSKS